MTLSEVTAGSAHGRRRCQGHGRNSPRAFRAAVGICDLGDRFRLTANEVDVVEPDEPLDRLPVACAVWEPRPSPPKRG